MQQRSVVYNNTVQAMAHIIKMMHTYNIPFANSQRERDARIVQEVIKAGEESEPFTAELAVALKNLWSDKGVSVVCYERRLEFHLHDSAKLYC